VSSDPAAVSWAKGRIDIVAKLPDGNFWHKYYEDGWSGWIDNLGSPLHTVNPNPTISTWGTNRLDVFVVGPLESRIYHKWWSKRWSDERDGFPGGWEPLSKIDLDSPEETLQIVSDAAAVSSGTDRIDIFVRGYSRGLDSASFYSISWRNGWTRWNPTGRDLPRVAVSGTPAVSSWGSGRFDIFSRGGDGSCFHKFIHE
jgi:hypothetical protein